MQKLTLSPSSSVIFLEQSERPLLSGLNPGRSLISSDTDFLKNVGIESNAPFLCLELFENDSGLILFVNDRDNVFPQRRVFRFSCVDSLLDGAAALPRECAKLSSELYIYQGEYYLASADGPLEALFEFADELDTSPSEFAVFLEEHGEVISESAAIKRLLNRHQI